MLPACSIGPCRYVRMCLIREENRFTSCFSAFTITPLLVVICFLSDKCVRNVEVDEHTSEPLSGILQL